MDVHDAESALMILRNEKKMYPLSTFAFTVTQSSQHQLRKNIGALILYRDGRIKEISSVKKLGFYGEKFSEKAKSALFGAYRIDTQLDDVEVSFSDLSTLIADYLVLDSKKYESTFELENADATAKKVRAASSVDEVFNLISLPDPEDCLDIL